MLELIKNEQHNVKFIHIGKCGGVTIREFFTMYNINVEIYHVRKPIIHADYKYIINIRNPITRIISAFQWRNYRMHTDNYQMYATEGEKEVFEKYQTLNDLAVNLYDNEGNKNEHTHTELFTIGHIKHNISFYLTELLSKINSEQILFVFRQENLNQDIQTFFDIKNLTPIHKNVITDKKYLKDNTLSDVAYSNLKKALIKDYDCIKKLEDMRKLNYSL